MKKHFLKIMKKTNLKHPNIYRVFLTPIFVILLTITSCVKQSDCDCGVKGDFVYLEKPYFPDQTFDINDKEIVAHFIHNNEISPIFGYIPKKYRIYDTVNVNVCLNGFPEYSDSYVTLLVKKRIFSLNCIELED